MTKPGFKLEYTELKIPSCMIDFLHDINITFLDEIKCVIAVKANLFY